MTVDNLEEARRRAEFMRTRDGPTRSLCRRLWRTDRNVLVAYGEVPDESDDQQPQDDADGTFAEIQSALSRGHCEPVRERRSQWPGDDVGEPEGNNLIEMNDAVGDCRDRDYDCEKDPGSKEAKIE
jgi:hypothetical protein